MSSTATFVCYDAGPAWVRVVSGYVRVTPSPAWVRVVPGIVVSGCVRCLGTFVLCQRRVQNDVGSSTAP